VQNYNGDLRAVIGDGLAKVLFLGRPVEERDIQIMGKPEALLAKEVLSKSSVQEAILAFANGRSAEHIDGRRFISELFNLVGKKTPNFIIACASAQTNLREISDPLIQVAMVLNTLW
jgi:hypothetical protein